MLSFSVRRLHKFDGEGSLKAIADIAIGNEFLVKGFCVVEGKNGLFVSEPRRAGNDGKWYGTACALSEEVKKEIEKVVMESFESGK